MRTFNILIFFMCLFGSLHAQFQEIYDYPELNSYDEVKDLIFKNQDFGVFLVSQQLSGQPYIKYQVTQDGGLSWFSDTLKGVSVLPDCINITDSEIIYFSCVKRHYDENNQLYYTRGVYKSINKGVDWTYHPIDNQNGQIRHRNLVFINDSVGMFAYGAGAYITTDYAETWTKVSEDFISPIGHAGNKFKHRISDTLFSYDPYIGTWSYDLIPDNCDCSLYALESKGDFVVASLGTDNGTSLGYPYPNYPALLYYSGSTTAPNELHFMSSGVFIDIDIQDNNTFFINYDNFVKTNDWVHFYETYLISPEASFFKMSFVNDTVGYVISYQFIANNQIDYRLWKTTNAGGDQGVLMSTVNPTTSVSELEKSKVVIYPNPTTGIVHIKNTGGETIQVINSTGKLLLEIPHATTMETIDLSSFASGIYFVHVAEQVYKVTKME